MLKLDLDKFSKQLKEYEKRQLPNKSGVEILVQYVCNLERVSQIDFNSFSLNDFDKAMNELEILPLYIDDDDEVFIMNSDSLFTQYFMRNNVLHSIHTYDNKTYSPSDDDVFL